MLGPKQRQLAAYVASANDGSLDTAGQQWKTGESLLRRLASQLETRSGQIGTDHRFSGESAKAASTAFSHSARKMADRADEMRDGAAAFQHAAQAVRQAQKASDGFAKHSGDRPPQQPPDLSDAAAQRDWKTQNNQFWNQFGDRETAAHEAVTALSDNHTTQAAVFAKIHGETPPPPPPRNPGSDPGTTTGTPPTTTHVPTGHPVNPDHDDFHPPKSHDDPPVDIPTPGIPHPPGDPGIPQGPGGPHQTLPGGPGLPGTTTPGGGVGGGIGAVGGVGAVAGGALGGIAAAGLASGLAGGLNGMLPVGGGGIRGGLSASGVRGIGSTSRTGVGSVLGRGAGAAGRAGAGGMAGRNGGRSGSRSAVGRGSKGRAGARGSAAGAGAGAGRNGKDKKRQGEERDLFDDGADWIDDEDAAPGLLD